MTKDTEEFSHSQIQWPVVTTLLPGDEDSSEPKGWIKGNTKIGPVLEVATSYLHGKYGVEVRIMSLNRDNTHSGVRISHGSNKFVMNLNNNETEIPEDQLEEYALKLSAKDYACRSKAKAKPQRREPAGSSTRTIPIGRRTWTDVEPGKIFALRLFSVEERFIFFVMEVYLETMMERLNSGESRTIFRNISCIVTIGLTKSGRAAWQEEEDTRKDFSIVLILQEQFCTSELSKVIQDAISLILHYKTMSLFRTVSSSTFSTSDVQSIFIPSSIQD